MKHCMVDIETLGTRPGSVILSIGATMFDKNGPYGPTFYRNIERSSCEAVGLTTDQGAIDFWAEQSIEARSALEVEQVPLGEALAAFVGWWLAQEAEAIWCHGGNFDEVLLSAAFRAVEIEAPWKYSKVRCTRTLYDLFGITPDRSVGTHHNALDDALSQAHAAAAALTRLEAVDYEKRIGHLVNQRDIQCMQGNFDVDEYMRGLANGLILGVATMRGEEPEFIMPTATDAGAAAVVE